MQVTKIVTDETLRELRVHGRPDFPFEYYVDDVHQFDGKVIEWHWHNEFEWTVVQHGAADCLVGTQRIRLHKGDGLFLNSKAIHRYESEGGASMPNILFAPEFLAAQGTALYQGYLQPALRSHCLYVVLRRGNGWEDGILKQLYRLFAASQVSTPTRELDLHILACTLWRDFWEHTEPLFIRSQQGRDLLLQARLRAMLQFIYGHYREKIALQDIAAAANISKSEALRCFHAGVQCTPVQYLVSYRLHAARGLLLSTGNTVSQIAAEAGFENTSYFVRAFAKAFGATPRAFRLQQREQQL